MYPLSEVFWIRNDPSASVPPKDFCHSILGGEFCAFTVRGKKATKKIGIQKKIVNFKEKL
jgi:hypothetical protein